MRVMLITGNGLSLSLLNRHAVEGVDLSNLFSRGSDVSWPADDTPGFLSFEHCPNLWALGARPHVDRDFGYQVIEKVITAVNACCMADQNSLQPGIYIKAYKELVAYLRYLFVHYDNLLQGGAFLDSAIEAEVFGWLQGLDTKGEIESVDVVTFNYDVIFERCLQKLGLDFDIPRLDDSGKKIKLYKPHGSISFCSKAVAEKSAFSIRYDTQFAEGGLADLGVRYGALDLNYPIVGILPPAGESDRYQHRWIREIWDSARRAVDQIEAGDLVVLYGLSYWHVDRRELDSLLAKVDRGAKVISINPYPNEHFDAVCCSLFSHYQSYSDARHLARILS